MQNVMKIRKIEVFTSLMCCFASLTLRFEAFSIYFSVQPNSDSPFIPGL